VGACFEGGFGITQSHLDTGITPPVVSSQVIFAGTKTMAARGGLWALARAVAGRGGTAGWRHTAGPVAARSYHHRVDPLGDMMCVAFAFCNLPLLALLFSLPVSRAPLALARALTVSCLPFNPPPTLRGSTFEGAGQEQEVVEELAARLGHTKVYKGKEDELRIGKRVLEMKHGLVYSACESTLGLALSIRCPPTRSAPPHI
jgi:hypothetical protein